MPGWNDELLHFFNVSELAGADALVQMIRAVPLEDGQDFLTWKDGTDIFNVKICYGKILKLSLHYFNERMIGSKK